MKLPPIPEHDIQANFIREATLEFRLDNAFISDLLYAVLNGPWIAGQGKGKEKLIEKYQEEGWKPGIHDVHYDQPRGEFNKLVIEFKRADRRKSKNGGMSDDQIKYGNAVSQYALVKVCYSTDEAMIAFREYMKLPDRYHPLRQVFNQSLFHDQFSHNRVTCEICCLQPDSNNEEN